VYRSHSRFLSRITLLCIVIFTNQTFAFLPLWCRRASRRPPTPVSTLCSWPRKYPGHQPQILTLGPCLITMFFRVYVLQVITTILVFFFLLVDLAFPSLMTSASADCFRSIFFLLPEVRLRGLPEGPLGFPSLSFEAISEIPGAVTRLEGNPPVRFFTFISDCPAPGLQCYSMWQPRLRYVSLLS